LINAYGLAAKQVLELAGSVQKTREVVFMVSVAFANEQELHRLLSKFEGKIESMDYNNEGLIAKISIRNSLSNTFEAAIMNHYQLKLLSN
jgi:putative IMPACT (imprinted ancient) family translation regulator